MIELLASGFAIGFLGSLHCIGMCGGLVSAMTMSRNSIWWPGVIVYQTGRVTTYTALGLVTGLLGSLFAHGSWLSNAQDLLSITAGILIITLALHIGGWLPDPFSRLSKSIATGLGRWLNAAANSNSISPWYSVGLINGLLPCGLVYAGLGLSLTAASAWQGAAVMLCFGLGTVPAMLAVPVLMRRLTPTLRSRVLQVGALLLIGIGVLTIARGTVMSQHEHAEQHHSMKMDISTPTHASN